MTVTGDVVPKESIPLAEINSVESHKCTFFIRSDKMEMVLEAASVEETNEWSVENALQGVL